MLKLTGITKIYEIGDNKVEALKGVSLCFRKNEFVSILGPSGCGKTTLLNIVGGLDRYTEGDLVINGKSTKEYKDKDWDAYRNHSVGFVFQSYNLIPHQTVLENVELALTLSGVSRVERRERAKAVLERVGLGDKLKNKPSQLSGGQMQRVAIARALVNDPEIILADEPTGALDTGTSVQIMEILKEISKEKLIIMVTHNPELAEKYSTRIVNLLDGNVTGDSNPFSERREKNEVKKIKEQEIAKNEELGITDKDIKKKNKKRRMSFFTALALSFKNLLTKKARTILVSFAGSIGIIGIALILAVSSGFSTYINKMQEDTLSNYPITIKSKKVDLTSVITSMFLESSQTKTNSHEKDEVYVKENISKMMNDVGNTLGTNNLEKFYAYIGEHYDDIKDYVNDVQYTYDLNLEYYRDNEINSALDISNIQPNSNAIIQMIIKYSLFYFEDKTSISFTENNNGTYTLHRPAVVVGETNAEKYPFIYNNHYSDLEYIVEALESEEGNGTIILDATKILSLVSTIMGLNLDLSNVGSSSGMSSYMFSMSIFGEMIDNEKFIKSQYTLLGNNSKFIANDKEHADEALLVLDKNNELDDYVLYALGLIDNNKMNEILQGLITGNKKTTSIDYDSIIGTTFKVLDDADYFVKIDDEVVDFRTYKTTQPFTYYNYYMQAVANCTNKLKIVGIVRLNETSDTGSLTSSVVYSKYFTEKMIEYRDSKIAELGGSVAGLSKIVKEIPSSINIYINSFDSKKSVKDFIEKYNEQADVNDRITYTDTVDLIMSTVSTIINAITYVLVAFVSVSLIVSSIMIGIITYISVMERTKEIGVLRSVGASKRDIKRVFTAESFIIGLSAGAFGIAISLALTLPINLILKHFTDISGLAKLPVVGSIALIAISVVLTLIAGLIPANAAAKKDPVVALREN